VGDLGEPQQPQATPWRLRPRPRLWQAFPSRFLQALIAFPYVCIAVLGSWIVGGAHRSKEPGSVGLLVVASLIVIPETIWLVLWLRRPVERSDWSETTSSS
jgi:hypothetical protein